MNIRKVAFEDADAVYFLICELEEQTVDRKSFEYVFQKNLKNEDIFYFAAEEAGKVIGFASVHIQLLLHHAAPIGELQEIVVSKQHQKTGAGRLLFEAAKKASEQKGCLQFELCCNLKRVKSQEFYLHMGMEKSYHKFTCKLEG